MLVLDFVRRTDRRSPAIAVPPFHAGHLGLVPGTTVSVGLPFPESSEVMVTPLHSPQSDLAVISATIEDDLGVVRDLVEVVSSFGYNVEIQESSSIDAHAGHHVHLIVDLSHPRREATTPNRIRHDYGRWKAHVPTHDLRYVELFTEIVARFGGSLLWRDVLRREVPDLSILPVPERTLRDPGSAEVEKRDSDDLHVYIPLGIAGAAIRRVLREPNARHLHYVYVSDTAQRNLRAYFFPQARAKRLVHLGFRHTDTPGQLLRILDLLAEAQFSIVTSLLRKHSRPRAAQEEHGDSLWEAIVEYTGTKHRVPEADFDDPAARYLTDVLPWARDRLQEAATRTRYVTDHQDEEISVGAPLYPRRYGGSEEAFVTLNWPQSKRRRSRARTGPPPIEKADKKGSEQAALVAAVTAYRRRAVRRNLFLSFPSSIKRAVQDDLMPALEGLGRYDLLVYRGGQGRAQTPRIVKMIRSSDYFIGIWHPDAPERGEPPADPVRLSPWMPFEFGVAFSRDIDRVLAVHDDVPEKAWDRIDRDTDRFRYHDDSFADDLVPKLVEFCLAEFP